MMSAPRIAITSLCAPPVKLTVACIMLLGTVSGQSGPDPPAAQQRRPDVITTRPASGAPHDLADVLEPIRKRHDVPALAGAIIRGGRLDAVAAVGLRKIGSAERVAPDDLFHIGSCTKAMTATMLAVLVEDGKLSWDATIGETFPDRREAIHADYRGVTLEQLLCHVGGTPGDIEPGLWGRLWRRRGTPTDQRLELLEGVLAQPPAHPPGTQYLYSNAGYAVAGAMAERVTGEPYEDLMRRHLFDPLGMTSAGFGPPGTSKRVDQPRGHVVRDGKPVPIEPGPRADNPPAIAPAGTVHCTLADWAKFVALHAAGGRSDARATLLKPETFKRLHAPKKNDYAMGWIVTHRDWGGRVLTHAGSNTMWYAVVWIAPDRDFAVLAATNQGGDTAAKACDAAAGALIRRRMERDGPEPRS